MTMYRAKRGLRPSYDLVTTSVYLPKDSLALTLNGTTEWPSAKEPAKTRRDAHGGHASESPVGFGAHPRSDRGDGKEAASYIKQHREFEELGRGMLQEWEKGSSASLRRLKSSPSRIIRKADVRGPGYNVLNFRGPARARGPAPMIR